MFSLSRDVVVFLFWMLFIHTIGKSHVDAARVKRIVGGKQAAKPPPDDPVVFTRMYNRDARVEGFRSKRTGIYSFLGLKYADPPVGQNRFARPRYRRLEGDINATVHGPPCPQPHRQNPNLVIGHEDCLSLDIYTPQMPDESTGLPVYIWIHPGGFRYGSSAQYNAEPVAQGGVIFVPIQYRLGTLGLIGDGSKEFSGNLAMYDMTAALRWVTEYISFFGGNPKQIKVIGHGSGATSAMYLSMSRLPRDGSITGTVAMSGSALSQYASDKEPVQSLHDIAEINECSGKDEIEIISCLRNKNPRDIVIKDSEIQVERLQGRGMVRGIAGSVGFEPHVETPDDGRSLPGFITDNAEESIKQRNFSTIPLLIGVAKQETGNAISFDAITSVWGTAEKFISSLSSSLNQLTSILGLDEQLEVLNVLNSPALSGVGNLGAALSNRLQIPDSLNPAQIVSKLVESTTEMFFSLPALLSAQMWGKTSAAYFYSFEYNGSISKGANFLSGLPIVSALNNEIGNEVIGHGDELGYIFDANDVEGKPLLEARITNPADLQVRQNFIDLLLNFAGSKSSSGKSILPTRLTGGKNIPYIKIGQQLDVSTDFKFCELLHLCQGLTNSIVSAPKIINNAASNLTKSVGLPDLGRRTDLGSVFNAFG